MLTAAELLDALCRRTIGSDRGPRGLWVSITEAEGTENWVCAPSSMMSGAFIQRWMEALDDLQESDPMVDWSGVRQRPGDSRVLAQILSETSTATVRL